ncbi:MAG: outer membrane lipoprotein-sorting protein [Candidatus Binatia bacterium]|nr:outer membrane lipoprotein-sorting protein [Candidatus Binatia bacterium]
MKTALLLGILVSPIVLLPVPSDASVSAEEVVIRARQQLCVPAEFVLGEMKVYRGDKLKRSYAFILAKVWDAETQTEFVRVDFKTAINDSVHADHRYLLKRTAHTPATQWLYLPALRRVRIVPYQPDDPLLQSDYLFYDLTAIHNFNDYHYRFVDSHPHAPVVEGTPRHNTFAVPYERAVFHLERRGETYLVTAIEGVSRGVGKRARFAGFREVAPGYYRPQGLTIDGARGTRTELAFHDWAFHSPTPQLVTPTSLETQALVFPATVQ